MQTFNQSIPDIQRASSPAPQMPLQSQFMALNDWLGIEVVNFEKYELLTGEGNKQ